MGALNTSRLRVRIDGRFFRLGERKHYLKGVTYGPFRPGAQEDTFASPEQTVRDFLQIRELGANLLRVYQVPPRWILDLASEHELKLMIDVPWNKDRCFLDSEKTRQEAHDTVRKTLYACAGHPAIFAYSVANEIPPDIARWSGAPRVSDFIDDLVAVAKGVDADCLCTFGNYPPTEFLRPRAIDFVSFNVYLHQQRALVSYLGRLQLQAESKPLILGEFGIDSRREGETGKCQMLHWTIEAAFRAGLAGAIVFSFTDEWFVGGQAVEDWSMGLTTRERQPKDSFWTVQETFSRAPYFPLRPGPKVSIVVATYNAGRVIKGCLDSLLALNYADYEVILVDDGSTDTTGQIASLYPNIRYVRQAHLGLSVARNTGIANATGEIIAFTDADCRPDEDWLYYLIGELLGSAFVGIGGPNYLPIEDSPTAAAVMASPGGPAPVMLTDRVAEHIPGCNMAFYKWALDELGGFDPIFQKAGDDVDLCWRLQERGYEIGFAPAGFVWHHRRPTIAAYLSQQKGYGEAEALLARQHPEYFNFLGASLWRGQIYSGSRFGRVLHQPLIYHGAFGTGFFQTLYTAEPPAAIMLLTSLEYHIFVTLPLLLCSALFHFLLPVGLASFCISLAVCGFVALRAEFPRTKERLWSRPLVALLHFLQPIVRGCARYRGRISLQPAASALAAKMEAQKRRTEPPEELYYWAEHGGSRTTFLTVIVRELESQGWPHVVDSGWCDFDLEIFGGPWSCVKLTSVAERVADSKQLFRCRLQAVPSLMSKLCLGLLCGLELLLVGLARRWSWLWIWALLGLGLLVLFTLFLERENRHLKNALVMLLDNKANEYKWTRIEYKRSEDKFVPQEEVKREA